MKRKALLRLRGISFFVLMALLAMMLGHMAVGTVRLSLSTTTSFPWWSAVPLAALYYALPILIVLAVYLYARWKTRG